MESVNKVINTLKENDEVWLVYGESGEPYKGYVDSVTKSYLIINESNPAIYRTFNRKKL